MVTYTTVPANQHTVIIILRHMSVYITLYITGGIVHVLYYLNILSNLRSEHID